MVAKLTRLLSFLFVLLILSPAGVIATEPAPCRDVLVIFARGSGQNPNHEGLEDLEDEHKFGDKEKQSYTFFQEISKRLPSLSVEKVSLHNFEGRYNPFGYQAVDAAAFADFSPDHRKDVPNRYYESVADGAEELTWFLEDRLTSCPLQQVILGGYSQGAHVVGDAMFKLKPTFRPRIAYVALYGDPKFNPRTSIVPVKTGPWTRGNVLAVQSGILLPRKTYIPDEFMGRLGSWCDYSDPICANHTPAQLVGANLLIDSFTDKTHTNNYQSKWIPQSANEIAGTIKTRIPHVQTIPWVNKNDKLYQLDLALVIDATVSMSSKIKDVKLKLSSFTNALFNSYWDTRIGVVGYADIAPNDPQTPYLTKIYTDFTYSKDTVLNSIQNVPSLGGGDEPEALYSGLMTAMNDFHWRPGAQKKILVITDATAKNPDPGPDHWTKEQVVKRALELDPVSISSVSLPRTYPYIYSGIPYYIPQENLFKETVVSLVSATNGINVEGQKDYKADYAFSALDQMTMQPIAAITGPSLGYVNESVNLSGGDSYDPNSYVDKYEWDCNNDGTWDVTSSLTSAECSYASAYSGFIVLQVTSNDGGSAKATLEISISNRNSAPQPIPGRPLALATRSGSSVKVSWQNNYPAETAVRLSDEQDNVIGYAPGTDSFTLTDVPNNAFSLYLAAGNASGWSEETTVVVPELYIEPSPTPTPGPEDKILPVSESNPEWLRVAEAEARARALAASQTTSQAVDVTVTSSESSVDSTTASDSVTTVAGVSIQSTPRPQISYAQATKPTLAAYKIDKKVLFIGVIMLAVGAAALLWKFVLATK